MPLAPGKHPAREVLQAFGLGKLDDASITQVSRHLETCVDCKRQVAELSGDSLLDKLRQANGPVGTPAPGQTMAPLSPAKPSQPGSVPPNSVPPELLNNAQYDILRELGAGGMGVVYLARNKLMDRLEVLKVISTAVVHKEGALDRFLREIRAAAALSHDNVVKAYTALQLGDLLVFAMEYVEGDDLSKVVKTQGPLAIANACYYARQVALGLQHAHDKNMVHRDIKPHNLILARVGKKHMVKILDFGLAKAASEKKLDRDLTGQGRMLGTPDYMAPEQILDAATADIRADIYSLGCTLYYLLTGAPPFDANSLFELLQAHQSTAAKPLNLLRPEVPVELAAVVAKMMAKQPSKRYQKPVEIAQALTPFFMKAGTKVPGGPPYISVGETDKAEPSRPEVSTKRSETVVPSPSETLVPPAMVAANPFAFAPEPLGQNPLPKKAKAKAKTPKRLKLLYVAVGVVFLGLVLWGVGLRVRTADGTIVLENLPPGAEVVVDGSVVKVTLADGKTFEVRVAANKMHLLEFNKEGFKFHSQKVEVDVGERKSIVVRVIPIAKVAKGDPPPPPSGVIPTKDDVAIVYLSDLKEFGWVGLGDFSNNGKAVLSKKGKTAIIRDISVNGVKYFKGLFTHPPRDGYSSVKYNLDGLNAITFETKVAINDDSGGVNNQITFQVLGDDISLWNSKPIMRAPRPTQPCKVSVENVHVLELRVNCPGKPTNAHAVWLDPCIFTIAKSGDQPKKTLKESGFVSLFNGKDLSGWYVESGDARQWAVEGDAIVGRSADFKTRNWLLSTKEYADFALRLQFMIDPGARSALGPRAIQGENMPQGGALLPDHPMIKLTDSPTNPKEPLGTTHWFINDGTYIQPSAVPQLATSTWHTMEVTVRGDTCVALVDGIRVVDIKLDPDPIASARIIPGLKRIKGRIGFQAHTGTIRFRNVEIKELTPLSPAQQQKAQGEKGDSASKADGFEQLFNGKDLTGWKTHPKQPGDWRVVNGILIDSGSAGVSHLYTERDDYKDFRLRAEARSGGFTGVYFRNPIFGPFHPSKNPTWLVGYNAKIDKMRLGGLIIDDSTNATVIRSHEPSVSTGQWLTLEVIALGNHIVLKVDGKTTADYTDEAWHFRRGHIALQQHSGQMAEFRKIEINELP
jgi:serine/threonine protein kinase